MKYLIIIIVLLNSNSLNAQIKAATRVGISSLNELQIEFYKPINQTYSFYSSFSYAYRGFNLNGMGCGTLWPSSLYDSNNSGFSLKMGYSKFKTRRKRNVYRDVNRTTSLSYRRFKGHLRINESGCSQQWNEYDFIANDIGVYHYSDKAFTKLMTFYFGIGYYRRFRKQIETPVTPTSGSFVKHQGRIVFDLGWRIALN